MNFKKIIKYLTHLLPWFLSSIIFKIDTNYYNNLNLPFFAPPSFIFPIVWTIIFILISISTYIVLSKSNTNYKIYLTINYLAVQSYTLCFFIIKNNLLSLADTLIVLISSLYLYIETKLIDKQASIYLIPYIIWNIFATILSLSIVYLN